MKSFGYKNTFCHETDTTTTVRVTRFGRVHKELRHVWGLEGAVTKNACCRPFLTSAKECREYVRDETILRDGK